MEAARTVVVTGGGTGIGRAIATLLAGRGMNVVVGGRREAPLLETMEAIRAAGGQAMAQTCDIREPAQVEGLFSTARATFGTVDALINNAGGQFPASALDISPRGWNAVLGTNLSGTFYCCQAMGRLAAEEGRGKTIVNMTIPWFDRGCAGLSHAVAARAGVVALTKSLAIEWAPLGVRVNCIAPGMVQTEGLVEEEFHGDPEGAAAMLAAVPVGRAASPMEIARAVAFMVSDDSSYMTGHTLVFDGAVSLGPGISFMSHVRSAT